jgi:hypothetical protein
MRTSPTANERAQLEWSKLSLDSARIAYDEAHAAHDALLREQWHARRVRDAPPAQLSTCSTIHTVMPEAGDLPVFVQGDAPNEWLSATPDQRAAIRFQNNACTYAHDERVTTDDGNYVVDYETITSLRGDNVQRYYLHGHVPYGREYAHDGARAAAAPK